jgi:hypothetical protein
MRQSFVLLVGQLTDSDIENSKDYIGQIKKIAFLAVIGTNDKVTQEQLDKLNVDYSRVIDLNKSLPSDLDSIFSEVYGCDK